LKLERKRLVKTVWTKQVRVKKMAFVDTSRNVHEG
jgi:hypothetical protein